MSEEENFKVTDRRGRTEEAGPQTPPAADPATSRDQRAGARPGGPPAELSALLVMFANSALISLGAVAEPGATEPRVDLDSARSAIDVLVMLREKTQGNRTEQESRLLEEILYDLQMRFVQVARPGG
jgi:hypothetical protein